LHFAGKIPLLKKEVNQNLGQVDAGTIESEVEKKKRRIPQDLKFSTPSKAQGGEYWRLVETDGLLSYSVMLMVISISRWMDVGLRINGNSELRALFSLLSSQHSIFWSGREDLNVPEAHKHARGAQARQRRTSLLGGALYPPVLWQVYPPVRWRAPTSIPNSSSDFLPCPDFRNFSRCRADL
jgi:hypothetical protein